MKLFLCIFSLSWAIFSHAESVIKSNGLMSELLAVGYNHALNDAKMYYEKNNLTYDKKSVENTLNFISVQLNLFINRAHYSVFERNTELTYFNLFLMKKLITPNELIFEKAFDTSKSHSICHHTFEWIFRIPLSPKGVLTSVCSPEINVKPVVKYTGIGDGSYYIYQHDATSLSYTSETVDGIAQYIADSESANFAAPMQEELLRQVKAPDITHAETRVNVTHEKDETYWLDNRAVVMPSGGDFKITYCVNFTGVNPDNTPLSDEKCLNMRQGHIDNHLPLAPKPDDITKTEMEINPFTDPPVKGRFLSALSQNALSVSLLTRLMNAAWREASALRGFNGIPFRSQYQVTDTSLTAYLTQSNTTLTQRDLYEVIPNGRISLYRWSDEYNAFVNEETTKKETVTVDVGAYPTIDEPTFEPPMMESVLSPIFNAFSFLKDIRLSPHSAACPAIRIPFGDKILSNDTYCDVITPHHALVKLIFTILWSLSGLFILFRSH